MLQSSVSERTTVLRLRAAPRSAALQRALQRQVFFQDGVALLPQRAQGVCERLRATLCHARLQRLQLA